MKEQQTPTKLSARSTVNRTGRSKDFQSKKISNKSLNASSSSFSEESVDFSPISEITVENLTEDATITNKSSNASSESFSEESVDFSPISEITEENLTEDATISNKSLNASSALFWEESVYFSPIPEFTEENLSKDATTFSLEEPASATKENLTEDATAFLLEEPASVTLLQPEKIICTTDACEFEMNKFTSVEDTMNFLQHFKADLIVTSDNADLRYKKLRDEIIEYVLQDLNHNVQPEDRSYTRSQSQVVSQKKPFLFLCVIVWFIGVLAVLFFTPDVDCGLVPT